jgi:hypothetical protein
MFKKIKTLTFFILFCLIFNVYAKNSKEDPILNAQNKINEAYKLGYVDAAPIEMEAIEKKVIAAREARDKRKKKVVATLIEQIQSDLKIVKKRFEVNELHKRLINMQEKNLESKKMLDDLKGQL